MAEKVGGASSYNILLSAPPLSGYFCFLSGKLFVFLLLVVVTFCHTFCCVFFTDRYSIRMLPFSSRRSPLSALLPLQFWFYSRDASCDSVRPIKTFLHGALKRKREVLPEDLSNFVRNFQSSSCFYPSGSHGLIQSSRQTFNYVAGTRGK